MFFMVTTTFPAEKAVEVGKAFTTGKLPQVPDFVQERNVFIVIEGDIKTYSIYECEDDKVHEGYKAIVERFTGYYEIKGWKHKVEHLLPVKEALPMLFPSIETNEGKKD